MKFEKISEVKNQRFYLADSVIFRGKTLFGEVDALEKWRREKAELEAHFSELTLPPFPTIVCISDSLSHAERLVFLGFFVPEEIRADPSLKYSRSRVQVGGAHTMMIHGGDPSSIKPDAVYLRQLSILNQPALRRNTG